MTVTTMRSMILMPAAALMTLSLTADPAVGQYDDSELPERIPEYAGNVAQAEERLDILRRRRDRARTELRQARSEVREQLRTNPEYDKTRMRVSKLRDQYRTARTEVREDLEADNEDYQQALERIEQIEDKIESLRDQPRPPQPRIVDLSRELLKWRDKADTILYDALEQRRDVDELQQQLTDATGKLDQLEARHNNQVATNSRVADARERLRDIREDMADARVNLQENRYQYRSARDQREERSVYDRGWWYGWW